MIPTKADEQCVTALRIVGIARLSDDRDGKALTFIFITCYQSVYVQRTRNYREGRALGTYLTKVVSAKGANLCNVFSRSAKS